MACPSEWDRSAAMAANDAATTTTTTTTAVPTTNHKLLGLGGPEEADARVGAGACPFRTLPNLFR